MHKCVAIPCDLIVLHVLNEFERVGGSALYEVDGTRSFLQ